MSNIQYDTGTGTAANWLIEETLFNGAHLGKCEAIFCQGNGYLGQRAALEEAYVGERRGLFVTGTFDRFSQQEVTELPNLPDMTALRLSLNGERFSMDSGRLLRYSRVFDLRNGLLTREVEWESPGGARYRLYFERFVSMDNQHLQGSRLQVTPLDGPTELTVESGIDGRVTNSGTQHFQEGEKRLYAGRYLETCSVTGQSAVMCCQHTTHHFTLNGAAIAREPHPIIDRRYLAVRLTTAVPPGGTFQMDRLGCIHTSRDLAYEGLGEPDRRAARDGIALLKEAETAGYDRLRDQSAAAWDRLWQTTDVEIAAPNGYHQLALRFALYHLNIMLKKDDNRVGIGAKGLSGEGYKGHSFWDTEMFILPYFSLVQPAAARTLLEYRWRGLYGARRKAAENGYSGAMYPWESAWIDDGEVTPLWGNADVVTGKPMKILTGLIEHHITADIAFAVWQYYTVTGDEDFMARCGYEIILETADFWAARCTWNEAAGRYEINDVIGPDEYKEHVGNNAYTNYMAAFNLKLAVTTAALLSRRAPQVYARLNARLNIERLTAKAEQVLRKLYLPKPGPDGIIPQFDGYFGLKHIDLTPYRESSVVGTIYDDYNNEQLSGIQVSKQADMLMLFFLLEDLFDRDVRRRNYEYYEPRTLHDSSLSRNTHCVLACDLGLHRQAEEFFNGSCNVDLGPVMSTSDMGIHSAAMGGIWQCAVYGFGGVRVVDGRLHIAPHLHSEWTRLRFPLIWRGVPLQVTVTAAPAAVTLENKGTAAAVTVNGVLQHIAVGAVCTYEIAARNAAGEQ